MHKVTWKEPNGLQWGHPLHPLVALHTRERKFETLGEARAFVEGLAKAEQVSHIQIDDSPPEFARVNRPDGLR